MSKSCSKAGNVTQYKGAELVQVRKAAAKACLRKSSLVWPVLCQLAALRRMHLAYMAAVEAQHPAALKCPFHSKPRPVCYACAIVGAETGRVCRIVFLNRAWQIRMGREHLLEQV